MWDRTNNTIGMSIKVNLPVCAVCVVYTCAMNTLPTITRAVTIPTTTDVNLFAEYLHHRDLRPHTRASYISAWRRIVTDLGGQTITTAAIVIWAPTVSSSSRAAATVPPVAKTSSTMATRRPARATPSAGISRVAVPYSKS